MHDVTRHTAAQRAPGARAEHASLSTGHCTLESFLVAGLVREVRSVCRVEVSMPLLSIFDVIVGAFTTFGSDQPRDLDRPLGQPCARHCQ